MYLRDVSCEVVFQVLEVDDARHGGVDVYIPRGVFQESASRGCRGCDVVDGDLNRVVFLLDAGGVVQRLQEIGLGGPDVCLEVAQGDVECDDHVDAFGVDANAALHAVTL
jgi:hypothetical protein